MTKDNFKYIFIICLLGLSSYVSWNFYIKIYTQEDRVNIHTMPREIDQWVAEDLTITDEEYEILETRNAFARKYTKDDQEVFFFTVYSESNRKVSHPPEVCYIGSGVTVTSNVKDDIDIDYPSKQKILANRLFLERGATQQLAYYWFKVGDQFTHSYWKQQFLIVYNTLLGKNPSSALIRVSATVKDSDNNRAIRDIKEFARVVIPQVYKHLP